MSLAIRHPNWTDVQNFLGRRMLLRIAFSLLRLSA